MLNCGGWLDRWGSQPEAISLPAFSSYLNPPPLFSTLYHYSFSLYYFPPLSPSLPLPSSLSSPLYHYSLFALDFYPTPFSVLPTSFLVLVFSWDSLFTLYYFNFSHFFFNLYSLSLFFFSLFAHPPPTSLPPLSSLPLFVFLFSLFFSLLPPTSPLQFNQNFGVTGRVYKMSSTNPLIYLIMEFMECWADN